MATNEHTYTQLMAAVKAANDPKAMSPVQFMSDVKGLPQVAPLTSDRKYNTKAKVVSTSMTEPKSFINVWGSRLQNNQMLRNYGLSELTNIPIISQIVGSGVHVYKDYIKPLVNFEFKDVLFNTLTEISEDLDILSNVIKGAVIDGIDSFPQSIGLGGYREIYNYNTGSTLLDIALEIVSDPLNLVQFGTKGSALLQKGDVLSDVSKGVRRIAAQEGIDISEDVALDLANTTLKLINNPDYTVATRLNKTLGESTLNKFINIATAEINNSKYYSIYKNTLAFSERLNNLEKAYTNFVTTLTPIGAAKEAKNLITRSGIYDTVYNSLVAREKNFNIARYAESVAKKGTQYRNTIQAGLSISKNINRHKYNGAINLLKRYKSYFNGLSTEEYMDAFGFNFVKYLKENFPKSKVDAFEYGIRTLNSGRLLVQRDYINFLDILDKVTDEVLQIIPLDPSDYTANIKRILKSAMQHSYDAASATYDYITEISKTYADLMKRTNNIRNWHLRDIPNEEKSINLFLEYIDKDLLKYNGKKYTLDNLKSFVDDVAASNRTFKAVSEADLNNNYMGYKTYENIYLDPIMATSAIAGDIITNPKVLDNVQQDLIGLYTKYKELLNEDQTYAEEWYRNALSTLLPISYDINPLPVFETGDNVTQFLSNHELSHEFIIPDNAKRYWSPGLAPGAVGYTDAEGHYVPEILDLERAVTDAGNRMLEYVGTNDMNLEHLEYITHILESYGITLKNSEQIHEIINSNISATKKVNAIRRLVAAYDVDKNVVSDILSPNINKAVNRAERLYNKEITTKLESDIFDNQSTEQLITHFSTLNSDNMNFKKTREYAQDIIGHMDVPTLDEIVDRINIDYPDVTINTLIKEESVFGYLNKLDKYRDAFRKDINTINTIKDLKDLYLLFIKIQSSLPRLMDYVTKSKYGIYTSDYVLNIGSTINKILRSDTKDYIVNHIALNPDMVIRHSSKFGLLNNFYMALAEYTTNNYRATFNKLYDPSSEYRVMINNLVDRLHTVGFHKQADAFDRIVSKIDTTRNISFALDMYSISELSLSQSNIDRLSNMLFDSIYNNGIRAEMKDVLQNTDSILKVKNSFRNFISYQYAGDVYNDTLLSIAKDNPELTIEDIIENLCYTTNDIIDTYVSLQERYHCVYLYDILDDSALDLINTIKADNIYIDSLSNESIKDLDTIKYSLDELRAVLNNASINASFIAQAGSNPISYSTANNLLRSFEESYNVYTASIESGTFATEWLIKNPKILEVEEPDIDILKDLTEADIIGYDSDKVKRMSDVLNLSRDTFTGSNLEYIQLCDRLAWYINMEINTDNLLDDYIEALRYTLINTYSAKAAMYAPVDPTAYFNSLDTRGLLVWMVVTRGNLSTRNSNNFYKYYSLYNRNITRPNNITELDKLLNLEKILTNIGCSNVDVFDEELATITNSVDAIHNANMFIKREMLSTCKSLDSLTEHKTDIMLRMQNNYKALEDVMNTMSKLETDSHIVGNTNGFDSSTTFGKFTGVNTPYEPNEINILEAAYRERPVHQAVDISNFTAEELATHLYKNCGGIMIFQNANILRVEDVDGVVRWTGIDKPFSKLTKTNMKEAGITAKKRTIKNTDYYLFRLTDKRVHNTKLPWTPLATDFKQQQKVVDELLRKNIRFLNIDTMDLNISDIVPNTINKDVYEKLLELDPEFFGDLLEQMNYLNLQKINIVDNKTGDILYNTVNNFFDNSSEKINAVLVGGWNAYNDIQTDILNIQNFHKKSTVLTQNIQRGLVNMIRRTNKINTYLTLVFNDDYSLNGSYLKTMFDNATDDEIYKFFNKEDWCCAVLKEENNEPRVYRYFIHDRSDLVEAAAQNGIIVPKETFINMSLVVNKKQMTNDLMSMYKRIVPSTFKTMFLTTLGFPFRNAIDTLIFKNANEMGGLEHIPEAIKYERAAYKAFKLHNKIQKEVFDACTYALQGKGTSFNKEYLYEILKNYSKEDINTYFLVDLFRQSQASNSFSESMADYLRMYNLNSADDIRPLWEKVYEDAILYGEETYNPLYWIRHLNDNIEQTGRLGLFLWNIDNNVDIPKAIKNVINTHFNYNSNGTIFEFLEEFFWFSTFPLNNLNYFLNGGLTKSPTLYKTIMDINVASWNNGEYTYEQVKNSNSLSWHAMSGSIRIGNIVIKTSLSFFDFLQLVTNPIESIKDRLRPELATAIDKDVVATEELNPLITQIRNLKKFKQGNPIPSIIGVINKYDNVKHAYKKYRNYNTSKSWNKYPKIKRGSGYIVSNKAPIMRRYTYITKRGIKGKVYNDVLRYSRSIRAKVGKTTTNPSAYFGRL